MKTPINALLQWIIGDVKSAGNGDRPHSVIVKRLPNGSLSLTEHTRRKTTRASGGQIAVHKRFAKAAEYAKRQMEVPERKELYTTGIKKKHQSAYSVALCDALKPPVVEAIDLTEYCGAIGDTISIDAYDDFKVARVRVIIKSKEDVELERGEAVQLRAYGTWLYTASVENRKPEGSIIIATAFDHAWNEATLEKSCEAKHFPLMERIEDADSAEVKNRCTPGTSALRRKTKSKINKSHE